MSLPRPRRALPRRRARARSLRAGGRGPRRILLDQRWRELQHDGSPQAFANALTGSEQLWWDSCQEAVREDPGWLLKPGTAEILEWAAENPADGGRPADKSVYAAARALVAPLDQLAEHAAALRQAARRWDQTGLLAPDEGPAASAVTGRSIAGVRDDLARRADSIASMLRPAVGEVITESESARAMVTMAALLLAGAERRGRPTVRVSLVFGRAEEGSGHDEGIDGILELREFPAGPVGLFPDPQAMAGASGNGPAFAESLAHAWHASSWRARRCVLWRIILTDTPSQVPPIEGGSLGAAFAVALRELFRYPASRRPTLAWARRIFYGLRPKTAITGVVDHSGQLRGVTGMDAKLDVARRKKMRLIAPKDNQAHLARAPDPGMVKFAATLEQAESYARQWRTRNVNIAAAVLIAATATAVITTALQAGPAAVPRIQANTVQDLPAVGTSLLARNAPLGILVNLQSYEKSATPQAAAALAAAAAEPLLDAISAPTQSDLNTIAFSPDGKTLASSDAGGKVLFYNLATGAATTFTAQADIGAPVNSIAFSPDGTMMAGGNDNTAFLADLRAGTMTGVRDFDGIVTSVAFSPDSRLLAVGGTVGGITLYDTATGGTATHDLGRTVNSVAFSPDGDLLAVGDRDDLFTTNASTGKEAGGWSLGLTPNSMAYSPDGKTLAAGAGSSSSGYGGIFFLNPRNAEPHLGTGRPDLKPDGGSPVNSVAFSPGGKMLAAGDNAGNVILYNLATRKPAAVLNYGSPINSVAYSPDGRWLAAGTQAGDIILDDVATGKKVTLQDGADVSSLSFSPDGRWLASGDYDQQVTLYESALWTSTLAALRTRLCDEVGNINLTTSQWGAYFPGQPYQKTCPGTAQAARAAPGLSRSPAPPPTGQP